MALVQKTKRKNKVRPTTFENKTNRGEKAMKKNIIPEEIRRISGRTNNLSGRGPFAICICNREIFALFHTTLLG